ncbi:MAG: hypothetical protein CMF94_02955 [Candidatus Marinimicrobia bacterium]|nr:hypothetical protein [Candidatus Neomarinimicrobiota bacterium]
MNRFNIQKNSLLKRFLYKCSIIILACSYSLSQPLKSFRPFDWVLYKSTGSITSFTEGYSYIYIGTTLGGIKRFNIYGNYFDNPISTAQGLENNEVSAVHFDKKTGFLWASTSGYVQYSFSRENDWFSKNFHDIGLSKFDKITKIGSSDSYVWLKARSSYVKLDQSSGTMVGIYPIPDELSIEWSSGEYRSDQQFDKDFTDFIILDGWIFNGNELIDQNGSRKKITSVFFSQYGNIYLGSENGVVFYGSETMETFKPVVPDIINEDVLSLYLDNYHLWVGSLNFLKSEGISKIDVKSLESFPFKFEETINMEPSPIYSIISSENEVWVGGEGIILYYNEKKNFWKTLDQGRGISDGIVWDMCISDRHLWTATSRGINRIDLATHSINLIGIEEYFRDTQVYSIENINDQIWIGSRKGLFIYSQDDPKLINALDLQKKDELINNFYNFTSIHENDDLVYVAGDMGVARFNTMQNEWELISPSVVYGAETVYSMTVNDKFLFLGTRNGLSRINKSTGLVREYTYPFIGQVNDMVLDGNVLWIGSNNGLLKFKWKRDL